MNHYCATVAYLGTPFYGFKRTKAGPTIQEELQLCLKRILQHAVTVEGASLTDRGVHAEGQVVQFSTMNPLPPSRLLAALRALLPKTITLRKLERVPPHFHPSLHATHKEYHYAICNLPTQLPFHRAFSWHLPLPLDRSAMQRAIPQLIGKRDFATFANQCHDHSRRHLMSISLAEMERDRLRIEIFGDRFLYKMARNLVGTLAWIGLGKIPSDEVPSLVASCDRRKAGPTAPAHGLTLKRVYY